MSPDDEAARPFPQKNCGHMEKFGPYLGVCLLPKNHEGPHAHAVVCVHVS